MGRNPRYIRSVRGRGYQLIAAPELITAESGASVAKTQRSRLGVAIPASITLLLVLGVLGAGLTLRPAALPPHSEFLDRARYYAAIGQKENNERAIALYRQALQQQPGLTAAALGLSFAYSARVCLYNFPTEWLDRSESLARTVLRTEPRNAFAYTALAYSQDCRGIIDAAIRSYEHAVRLDPAGRRDALASVAYLYEVKGRLADALRTNLSLSHDTTKYRHLEIQIARTLELLGLTRAAEPRYAHSFQFYPDNLFSNIAWPRFLLNRGRLPEAQAALDQALARGTDRNDLLLLAGELALLRGDRETATQHFDRATAMRPHSTLAGTLAMVYGAEQPAPDRLRERIVATTRSIEAGDRWPDNWLEIALLQIALGDPTSATAALNHAVDVGFLDKDYLQMSPLFRSLSRHPGFARVVETITHRVDEQRRTALAAGLIPNDLRVATAAP
jgi:tetratricopeptide (TPR) repeat protein